MNHVIFTLLLTLSLSASCMKKPANPPTVRFEQLVLDSERAALANPSVWISRAGCYSAVIHPDTNVSVTESTRWIESRYQFEITKKDMQALEGKVGALLTEGRRKFRDPVPGERIDSLFVITDQGGTVCIEKPGEEPWVAFDQVKEYLLQMHGKFAKKEWLIHEAEADYPALWSPPGFQSQAQRGALQFEERRASKNFLENK